MGVQGEGRPASLRGVRCRAHSVPPTPPPPPALPHSVVAAACLGNNACWLTAAASDYGNPCPAVPRALSFSYTCGAYTPPAAELNKQPFNPVWTPSGSVLQPCWTANKGCM